MLLMGYEEKYSDSEAFAWSILVSWFFRILSDTLFSNYIERKLIFFWNIYTMLFILIEKKIVTLDFAEYLRLNNECAILNRF